MPFFSVLTSKGNNSLLKRGNLFYICLKFIFFVIVSLYYFISLCGYLPCLIGRYKFLDVTASGIWSRFQRDKYLEKGTQRISEKIQAKLNKHKNRTIMQRNSFWSWSLNSTKLVFSFNDSYSDSVLIDSADTCSMVANRDISLSIGWKMIVYFKQYFQF